MRKGLVAFQIGKNGLTDNFIASLGLAFKNRKIIKVQILPSAADERAKIRNIADGIVHKLAGNYKYNIVGFTIVMRRVAKLI